MTTVTDGSYVSRILGLLGERNPLESLESSAKRVEALARRLGDAGLSRSWGPGKWTGKQILAHLADAELAIGFRTRQVLAQDNHTIQPFDQSAWARRYVHSYPESALDTFIPRRR